ncbi:tol-pal system protein YbgF [Thiothrix lacustris]|uniref:Cell division coordinator CpoB n=1 Tax=Thiothrix lacustris TaxID=525917 RepID=A0ABY9MV38_9GAMM|nr:tol-pal system protein YbgF [Thiothrix lacustris]WML92031.1 tol-pal system protein YbgF [Thiothrix lacustris]
MQNKLSRSALGALVATMLAAPAWAEPMPDEAAIQLLQRVNELEQDLRNIRGDNEKLQHELDTVRKSQKDNFQQVDERLEKLRDNSAALNADKPAESETDQEADKDTAAADQNADTDKVADTTTEKATTSDPNGFYSYGTGKSDDKNPSTPVNKPDDKAEDKPTETTATATNTDTGDATKALPEKEERAVYDDAFQTLLKDPKASIPVFRSFIKDYPKSPLTPSAQYWVGEALYAEKDFKAAIEEFLVVLKEHKGSDKAPDAALKLGYSFYELKEWDKARKTLEDVISFFPDNADTTKMAQERLEKMKTEGH